jgi:hypothetical protein
VPEPSIAESASASDIGLAADAPPPVAALPLLFAAVWPPLPLVDRAAPATSPPPARPPGPGPPGASMRVPGRAARIAGPRSPPPSDRFLRADGGGQRPPARRFRAAVAVPFDPG